MWTCDLISDFLFLTFLPPSCYLQRAWVGHEVRLGSMGPCGAERLTEGLASCLVPKLQLV